MLSLDEARAIADEYAKRTGSHWFEPGLSERDSDWVARVGFIGSMGIGTHSGHGARIAEALEEARRAWIEKARQPLSGGG